jgi:copper chaperone CopZ
MMLGDDVWARVAHATGRCELINHSHIAYGVPGLDSEAGALLEKRLERLPGVHEVTVWLGEQQIEVDYDPDLVSPAQLSSAIQQLGYLAKFVSRGERWPG